MECVFLLSEFYVEGRINSNFACPPYFCMKSSCWTSCCLLLILSLSSLDRACPTVLYTHCKRSGGGPAQLLSLSFHSDRARQARLYQRGLLILYRDQRSKSSTRVLSVSNGWWPLALRLSVLGAWLGTKDFPLVNLSNDRFDSCHCSRWWRSGMDQEHHRQFNER